MVIILLMTLAILLLLPKKIKCEINDKKVGKIGNIAIHTLVSFVIAYVLFSVIITTIAFCITL